MTREPEWDEESRGRALRLAEYEAGLCRCGCGQPYAIAHDKTQVFMVDEDTCQARRAVEKVERMRAEEAKERKAPEGWDDGRHYSVRPHDPDRDPPLKPRGGADERQVSPGPSSRRQR